MTKGTLSMTLRGHTGPVVGCAVVGDTKDPIAVSASADGSVMVWRTSNGALLSAFSPTGKVAVAGGFGRVRFMLTNRRETAERLCMDWALRLVFRATHLRLPSLISRPIRLPAYVHDAGHKAGTASVGGWRRGRTSDVLYAVAALSDRRVNSTGLRLLLCTNNQQ